MFQGGKAQVGSLENGETVFFEAAEKELREQIFLEFNTLAVVYGVPSVQFIDEMFQQTITKKKIVVPVSPSTSAHQVSSAAANPAFTDSVNLLDMGDEPPTPSTGSPHVLKLNASATITPADFQSIWAANPDAFNR